MPPIFRAHISNLWKRTHWQGRINRWVWTCEHGWKGLVQMHQTAMICLPPLPRTYFWSRDKCLWRRGMWSSFSRLLKSTQMPPAASLTTCSMSLCLPLSLFASFLSFEIATLFSKHMTHNPLLPTSASVQCFSPEPARQVMLHHVWILAGPSLLDEVGLEWLHGILGYRNHTLTMSLHCTLSGMHRLKYYCLAKVTVSLILFINLPPQLPAVVHQ